MKKIALIALIAAAGAMNAQAEKVAYWNPSFGQNWSLGVDGGVTTPLHGHAFFGSMRGAAGLHLQKQLTPTFALGVEGIASFNTSSWGGVKSSTVVDNTYVGAYGAVNLFNLFGGYQGKVRPFDIEAVAGAGWGHDYYNDAVGKDHNYFATKAGLNFNFRPSEKVTISIKPSVVYDMSDARISQTSAGYNINNARFDCMVGVTYNFGGSGFDAVTPYNQAEVDALNARINDLRVENDAAVAALAASQAQSAALAADLAACQNRKPTVVKEVTNNLNSVRYVFYKVGSSKITADQQPNIEMIAAYLKKQPKSKVVVKGYASPEGNLDFNIKLAAARAESVKTELVKKYGISESRITAEGEGIGKMFTEESWNRVSICTIEE